MKTWTIQAAGVLLGLALAGGSSPRLFAQQFEGMWQGSWGGGVDPDGIGRQPVRAEMVVDGDQVIVRGFPQLGDARGGFRIDQERKRLWISRPATAARPLMEDFPFSYRWTDQRLTLIDDRGVRVDLERASVEPLDQADILVQVTLELVPAATIDADDMLILTRHDRLEVASSTKPRYARQQRRYLAKTAKFFHVLEDKVEEVSWQQARELLQPPRPVALVQRVAEDGASASPSLWRTTRPRPDSGAALRTYARLLRPGSLLVVLPVEEPVRP